MEGSVQPTDNEIWRAMPEFDFEVSSFGNKRNKNADIDPITGLKKLSQPSMKNGYLRFTNLKHSDGTEKTRFVHRLVAITFLDNPENKFTVDHKDRNKLNNHVSNLCWATQKEQAVNKNKSQKNMINKPVWKIDVETGEKELFMYVKP